MRDGNKVGMKSIFALTSQKKQTQHENEIEGERNKLAPS